MLKDCPVLTACYPQGGRREEVGGIDVADEYSEASKQFFLSLWRNTFLNWGVFWAQEKLGRFVYAPSQPSVLEAPPFIIFLNKSGQWQCKRCLNKSVWLMEIKPKGK